MKKTLLSAFALGAVVSASAQSITPASGVLSLTSYEAGVSSIEVTSSTPLVVNRACSGMAVLRHDGEIVKQMPASNLRAVYTYQGQTPNIPGTGHITFFEKDTHNGRRFGIYTAEIPEGYFAYEEGNSIIGTLSAEWKIETPDVVYSPANYATIETLRAVRLTFPSVGVLSFAKDMEAAKKAITLTLGEETQELDENGLPVTDASGAPVYLDRNLHPSNITINGQEILLYFPVINRPQRLSLSILPDIFNFTVSEGAMARETPYGNPEASLTYDIQAASLASWSITPLVQFFEGGIPAAYTRTINGQEYKGWFELSTPSSAEPFTMASQSSPYLVNVNADGSYSDKVAGLPAMSAYMVDGHTLLVSAGNQTDAADPGELSLPSGSYALFVPSSIVFPVIGKDLWLGRFIVSPEQNPDYTISPDPAESVSEIASVSIIFPEGTELGWTAGQYVKFTNADSTIEYNLIPIVEDNVLVINFPSALITEGTWSMIVGSAGLSVNGHGKAIDAVFTISEQNGVAITTAPERCDVYNLGGMKVLDQATPEQIRTLPRGIYIAGGVKILVK